jgi:O-antigen ligase
MGHWMTFSGEQLLVWCAAVPAMNVLGRRWLAPLTAVGTALILSFTKGVWIGAIAGIAVIALAAPRKALLTALIPSAIVAGIASGLIYHRISQSFEEEFTPVTSRIEMLSVAARMVQDHPLFGVGPERISREFPRYYNGDNLENFYYGHLHNNILQIAAERGLLCLAAFLWLIFAIYADLISMLKRAREETRWVALSALAALTGFVVAGFFEYNFGDSEVLLLLLFVVSIPYGSSTESSSTHSEVESHGIPIQL